MVRAGELCHSFLRRRWVSKYIIWKLGGVPNSRDSRDFSISLIFNLFSFKEKFIVSYSLFMKSSPNLLLQLDCRCFL